MKIIIDGPPIAQKRPRFFRRGNRVGTYNPQESEAGQWLLQAIPQIGKKLDGPLDLGCLFIFPRPKAHYGTGRNAWKLKASAPKHHIKTPDCDNLVKWVKDCLNGRAYDDDKQVVTIQATKKYVDGSEDHPRTEIFLKPTE